MKRVLVPTDDIAYLPVWQGAYGDLGWHVTGGRVNFQFPEAGDADLVHLQWPEELSGGREPTDAEIAGLVDLARRWKRRARLVGSVNNLYPHTFETSVPYRRLYEAVFGECEAVHHFSEASKRLVLARYPSLARVRHVVQLPGAYQDLLPRQVHGRISRASLGLGADERVVLVFGALRTVGEFDLLRRALAEMRAPKPRLLVSQRFNPRGRRPYRVAALAAFRAWCRLARVAPLHGFIPQESIGEVFAAADLLVVPRIDDLSSGLTQLALTFGKPVVAPELGALPEYLAGSRNVLYRAGDPVALARAVEHAFTLDLAAIGRENAERAASLRWSDVVRTCLDSVGLA